MSHLLLPDIKRAVVFCTACNRRNKLSEMPYRSELQWRSKNIPFSGGIVQYRRLYDVYDVGGGVA